MPKFTTTPKSEQQILDYVEKAIDRHPPIPKATADYTMNDPENVAMVVGPELLQSFAVEKEVDRNVKELGVLLHELPAADHLFIHELWWPHEKHHAILLDQLVSNLGFEEPPTDLDTISPAIRIARSLGRIPFVEDIFRLQYYLTGAATEKSASHLYRSMDTNLTAVGETAIASTIIRPIKRQEPVHDGFYGFSAHNLAIQMSPPQLFIAKTLRKEIFKPVGVTGPTRKQQMGNLILRNVGPAPEQLDDYLSIISRVEREILYASDQGMKVPGYMVKAFRSCIDAHQSSQPFVAEK